MSVRCWPSWTSCNLSQAHQPRTPSCSSPPLPKHTADHLCTSHHSTPVSVLLSNRLAKVEAALQVASPVPRSRPLKRISSNQLLNLAPRPPTRPIVVSSSTSPEPADKPVEATGEAATPAPAASDDTLPPPPPTVNVIPPPPKSSTPKPSDPIPPPPKAKAGVPPPRRAAAGAPPKPTSTPPASLRIRSAAAREALLRSNKAAADSTAPPTAVSSSTAPAGNGSVLLDHHHALQEELISSLASMSGQLKTNALGFGDKLEKDKEVMEEAKQKLEENHEGMVKQAERLKGYSGKQKGTTCWTIAVVAGVAVAWVGVFMLIKVT